MKANGISDVGKIRQNNEDSFYCSLETALFIVADGLGGHSAGEVASSMTVEHVSNGKPKNIDDLLLLISEANTKVHNEAKVAGNDMATTISSLIFPEKNQVYIAHVGDSRIYLIRDNEIYCITEDHTPVMESLREGLLTLEQSKRHPLRHMLSRTIGTHPEVEIDAINIDILSGDIFVLCTDGLSNLHEDYEIRDVVLKDISEANIISKNLVESALERGGTDNVTVVVLIIEDSDII